MARPSKLTQPRQERLIEALQQGAHYNVACQAAGVDYSTYRRWRLKGEAAASGKYREFYLAALSAEALGENRLVSLWYQAAQKDWRAAAEFLARRWPESWAPRRVVVQVNKPPEGQHPLERLADAIDGWRRESHEEE